MTTFAHVARTLDGPVVLHVAEAESAFDPDFFLTGAKRAAHVAHDLSTVVEVGPEGIVAAIAEAMANMGDVTAGIAAEAGS